VLVHKSAVLDALLVLFEYVWAAAVPLRVSGIADGGPRNGSKLSEHDRTVLSLLLAGLSDEAIAMHVGKSVRTVQRRVRGLMSLANVGTRMQLAWEAARQGWV
jgi:DNA-binding NarL/FixJ family response regulator